MGEIGSVSMNSPILMEQPEGNYGVDLIACKCCGELKEPSKFNIDRSSKRGYHRYCKLCRDLGKPKDMQKQRRSCSECGNDITHRVASAATCSLKCAEIRAGKKAKGDQFLIFNRDGCRCQYCGRTPTEDDVKIVCDHIVPKVDGGEDTADNLVTCCAKCNSSKSDRKLSQDTMSLIITSIHNKNEKLGINPKKIITGSHCRDVVVRRNEQTNQR